MQTPIPETYFDERLTIAVPVDFRDAVRTAADRSGLTIADYTREALAERMDRDGVRHPNVPTLSQKTSPAAPCPLVGYSVGAGLGYASRPAASSATVVQQAVTQER